MLLLSIVATAGPLIHCSAGDRHLEIGAEAWRWWRVGFDDERRYVHSALDSSGVDLVVEDRGNRREETWSVEVVAARPRGDQRAELAPVLGQYGCAAVREAGAPRPPETPLVATSRRCTSADGTVVLEEWWRPGGGSPPEPGSVQSTRALYVQDRRVAGGVRMVGSPTVLPMPADFDTGERGGWMRMPSGVEVRRRFWFEREDGQPIEGLPERWTTMRCMAIRDPSPRP